MKTIHTLSLLRLLLPAVLLLAALVAEGQVPFAGQRRVGVPRDGCPRVALVLGGGGAKGAAAVGVLKSVEASGVPVDMVVGTSIGSIVGGLYALGHGSRELDSLFRTRDWLRLFAGSLMGDSIATVLRGMMPGVPDSLSFDSLPVPFRCVAVDAKGLREVVLSSGSLAEAMRASMAIPLVFKPVRVGGMTLVDGGVLNNLPVDVAREMGADLVIAVDLTVNHHDSGRAPFLRPDLRKYRRNVADADLCINPDLSGYGAQSFTPQKIAEMIAIGEQAGERAMHDLRKLRRLALKKAKD